MKNSTIKALAILVAASFVSGAALATEATGTTTPAAASTAPAVTTAPEVKKEDVKKKKKKKKKDAKATTSSSVKVSSTGTTVAANTRPTTSELEIAAPVATPAATTTTSIATAAPAAAKKVTGTLSLNLGDSIANIRNNELKGSVNSTENFVQLGYKIQPKLSVGYRQMFMFNGNTEVAGVKKSQIFQAQDGFIGLTKVGGPVLGSADNTVAGLRLFLPISEASKAAKLDTKVQAVGSADWEINSKVSINVSPLLTLAYAEKKATSLSAVAQVAAGYNHTDKASSYVAWIPSYKAALPESSLLKATLSKEAQTVEVGASYAPTPKLELSAFVDVPVSGKLGLTKSTLKAATEDNSFLGIAGTARFQYDLDLKFSKKPCSNPQGFFLIDLWGV